MLSHDYIDVEISSLSPVSETCRLPGKYYVTTWMPRTYHFRRSCPTSNDMRVSFSTSRQFQTVNGKDITSHIANVRSAKYCRASTSQLRLWSKRRLALDQHV